MSGSGDGRGKGKKGDPQRDSGRPTVVPPVATEELAQQPEARRTPGGMRAVRDRQVTITDEAELELARQKSMEVVTPATPQQPVIRNKPDDPATDMNERFALGDFSGALSVAEAILVGDHENPAATQVAKASRERLTELYEARLGSVDRVPVLLVDQGALRGLEIDHRAGFLLSHIDGVSSLETILDVSGMPRFDALKILLELVQKRVVALR